MPLLHDPGERWTYGIGIDWLGVLIARVRGERLEHVFRDRIYEPCGMTSTSFDLSPEMAARAATVHRRLRSGEIVPGPRPEPSASTLDMGGHGLWSTVPGRARPAAGLARRRLGAWRPACCCRETIEWAVRSAPGVTVTPLEPAIPALTRPPALLPGASDVVGALVPARRRRRAGAPPRGVAVVGRDSATCTTGSTGHPGSPGCGRRSCSRSKTGHACPVSNTSRNRHTRYHRVNCQVNPSPLAHSARYIEGSDRRFAFGVTQVRATDRRAKRETYLFCGIYVAQRGRPRSRNASPYSRARRPASRSPTRRSHGS